MTPVGKWLSFLCSSLPLSPSVMLRTFLPISRIIRRNYDSIEEILPEQREPCLNITDLNMLMSRISDEFKVCLLNRKENITDLDSISVCTAKVKKFIQNRWENLEYHAGIKDPGRRESRISENFQQYLEFRCLIFDMWKFYIF